jgi:hypothetical protein
MKALLKLMKRRKLPLVAGEQSFTLIETVIALGLMVTVIFEVSGVQGNAVYFSEFERSVTQATWIAKAVMSRIEYEWDSRPFSDMKQLNATEKEYEDNKEFTYAVKVEEWKLPLLNLLTGGGGDDGEQAANPQGDMIKGYVEKIFGDEILKIANVEVFWPEGAKKNSVSVTMLLTNQQKLDETIATLGPLKDAAPDKQAPSGNKAPEKPPVQPPGGGVPGADGGQGTGGDQGSLPPDGMGDAGGGGG